MALFRNRSNESCPSDAEQAALGYGPVVELVRQLGDAAISRFLDDLSPRLDAFQRRTEGADRELASFLHNSAVSAVIIKEAGGIDNFNRRLEESSAESRPTRTADELLADLQQIK